jgi:hypothetical protein
MSIKSEHIKQANMQIAKDKYPELSPEDAYVKLMEDIAEWHKKQMPSLGQAAIGLAGSLRVMAQHHFREVLDEEYNRRMEICSSCEYLDASGRCVKCRCPMRRKARWEGMICKDGRW